MNNSDWLRRNSRFKYFSMKKTVGGDLNWRPNIKYFRFTIWIYNFLLLFFFNVEILFFLKCVIHLTKLVKISTYLFFRFWFFDEFSLQSFFMSTGGYVDGLDSNWPLWITGDPVIYFKLIISWCTILVQNNLKLPIESLFKYSAELVITLWWVLDL